MSTLGQKRCNHRVEDDGTSSSLEHSGGMLVRTAQNMVLSDFDVTEIVPQYTNPIVAQQAFGERATHEVFKCYLSKLTINELRSCALECHLPCGTRVIVPSPDDYAVFPPAGFVAINPQHLEFRLRFPL